jgi:hypothetical protein
MRRAFGTYLIEAEVASPVADAENWSYRASHSAELSLDSCERRKGDAIMIPEMFSAIAAGKCHAGVGDRDRSPQPDFGT